MVYLFVLCIVFIYCAVVVGCWFAMIAFVVALFVVWLIAWNFCLLFGILVYCFLWLPLLVFVTFALGFGLVIAGCVCLAGCV